MVALFYLTSKVNIDINIILLMFCVSGNVALFGGPSYWAVLISLVVLVSSICIVNPVYGTMGAFAFLGGYLLVHICNNYIFGGRLQYITINPLRRLTESGFDESITTPPLQAIGEYMNFRLPKLR